MVLEGVTGGVLVGFTGVGAASSPRLASKGERNGFVNVDIAAFELLSLCRFIDADGADDKLDADRLCFTGVEGGTGFGGLLES